jgi:hypothetical protein
MRDTIHSPLPPPPPPVEGAELDPLLALLRRIVARLRAKHSDARGDIAAIRLGLGCENVYLAG